MAWAEKSYVRRKHVRARRPCPLRGHSEIFIRRQMDGAGRNKSARETMEKPGTSPGKIQLDSSSLFYCYSVCLITIERNSISRSSESSWKIFCESLCLDRKIIPISLLWGSANGSRRTKVVSSMINI